MSSLGSLGLIRAISSLLSTSPGTMAPALMAASRRSSRRSAFRAALSGPWHAKQFSARIGRTSRLYSKRGRSAAVAGAWQSGKSAIKRTCSLATNHTFCREAFVKRAGRPRR